MIHQMAAASGASVFSARVAGGWGQNKANPAQLVYADFKQPPAGSRRRWHQRAHTGEAIHPEVHPTAGA